MDKKIKLFLFGLIGLSFISIIFAFFLYMSKQKVVQDYNVLNSSYSDLKDESEKLYREIKSAQMNYNLKQKEVGVITQELNATKQDRDQILEKFEILKKELNNIRNRVSSPVIQTQASVKIEPVRTQVKEESRDDDGDLVVKSDEKYWAGILKQKSSLAVEVKRLQQRINEINIKVSEIENEKSDFALQLRKSKQENDNLIRELDYNKKLADNISLELLREKRDKRELLDQFKTIREENFVLSNQLKQTLSAKLSLEKKIDTIRLKKDKLDEKISQVDIILQQRLDELGDIRKEIESTSLGSSSIGSSIELPAIIVKPDGAYGIEDRVISARVVSVDRKNNFAIVNLGKEHGIDEGKIFKVLRNNTQIGVLQVIQVRKSVSACDIKEESVSISVGDKVL
ncbi:MAG: hypothetical protein P9L96_03900 [Candidatus Gygaella obscura]|nr:hypothetical protein [Candidatus Gygaella obscura]